MAINLAQRWWELMQQNDFGMTLGEIPWNQLGAQGQKQVEDYFNTTIKPQLLGKTRTTWDGNNISNAVEGQGLGTVFGENEALAQALADPRYQGKLDGVDANNIEGLPQTSQLYVMNPQLAESMGITKERATADANAYISAHGTARQKADAAANKEGWLMALGTIGAGVGGAYMNGTLSGAGSSGLTAAEQNALMGGLGDTTADIGAGILEGGASVYDGATLGGSFIDPTTGLTYGADGLGGGTGLGNLGADLSSALSGTGITASTALQTLASKGVAGLASLLSGSGLANTAVNAILNNLQKNSTRDDFNQALDTVTSGITNANQLRDLADPARAMLTDQSFLNSAKSGITGLQDMFNNPNNYAGYGAATTANNASENFIRDPMSDPGFAAALALGAENTARKSSSGRGLNSGSFMAEQNAANLATAAGLRQETLGAYGAAANAGMNQFNGLADIGAKGVNAAISGANANTQQGSAAATAANAHLAALGGAYRDALSPMLQTYKDTNLTGANIRSATGGGINFEPVINKGLDWLSRQIG